MSILAAIEAGIKKTDADYEVIENRREAIRQAMEIAVGGDIVILAGDRVAVAPGAEDHQQEEACQKQRRDADRIQPQR